MKTILAFLAACAVVIFAVGCGGGSGSDRDRIIDRIRSLISDANREDISETMRNYSLDYCDDVDFCGGGNYQDERNCWVNTYTSPNSSVRFSDLRVLDVQVNQAQTEGYIDAVVHFIVFDEFGGVIGENDYEFRMFMTREGNEWLMWGDGNCEDSSGRPVPSFQEHLKRAVTKGLGPATRAK
ncbi:MAG: hypothetical protein M3R13_00510 [Armatimonadota bacterium]|nr:hypothetical protein [Armatimonadota bacterium]